MFYAVNLSGMSRVISLLRTLMSTRVSQGSGLTYLVRGSAQVPENRIGPALAGLDTYLRFVNSVMMGPVFFGGQSVKVRNGVIC